jgi:hypothetical protein
MIHRLILSCDGARNSRDAIVILGQKGYHSSYGHVTSVDPILLSLNQHYEHVMDADVLIWHQNITEIDLPKEIKFKPRLCNVTHFKGLWGPPTWDKTDYPPRLSAFSLGYHFMIRFYSVTIWQALIDLGYEWMLRFDDDSQLLSPVTYNFFDFMRTNNKVYGFRSFSKECGRHLFTGFVNKYAKDNEINLLEKVNNKDYCSGYGGYGFYNNFYISRIDFWLRKHVLNFTLAFDFSRLTFIERDNDLIFQTAAVRLFANMTTEVHHFMDFTYVHHTLRNGHVKWGGLDVGLLDEKNEQNIDQYVNQNKKQSKDILICIYNDTVCGVFGGAIGVSSVIIKANMAPFCCGTDVIK